MDAWKLGKNDQKLMFVDYFQDETDDYVDNLETAMFAAQYEMSCEVFAFDTGENEYLSYYYDQVRASENWTEAEVSELTYVYGYAPSAEVPRKCNRGKTCEPGLVLTVDHQGCMTPMATGIMLVKDVAGKAFSRVL